MLDILIVHGGANILRARAAAILVSQDPDFFDCIIFSGGQTGGIYQPSEAEGMKGIFFTALRILFPEYDTSLLEKKIILEKLSLDTEDNAQRVMDIMGTGENLRLTLLSSFSHLPRIKSIYARLGFRDICTISAEGLLYHSKIMGDQSYIVKYMQSYGVMRAAMMEIPLYILTQYTLGRIWIRSKTKGRIREREKR